MPTMYLSMTILSSIVQPSFDVTEESNHAFIRVTHHLSQVKEITLYSHEFIALNYTATIEILKDLKKD